MDRYYFRDTLIVVLGNCGTSILSGLVVFSIIGHMAFKLGLDVSEVASQGKEIIILPTLIGKVLKFVTMIFRDFWMLINLGHN